MASIRRRVMVKGDFLILMNEKWLEGRERVARNLGEVPFGPYTVEYRLNRKGSLKVVGRGINNAVGDSTLVCFLPRSWYGKRVSRRVVKVHPCQPIKS